MRRIWHPFTEWEEVAAGLWSSDLALHDPVIALEFMRNVPLWGETMRRVTVEWPRSAEQNLSHAQHNRVAWLGQAAVCLATGLAGSSTRKAWWGLTEEQQERANTAARAAITEWEGQCRVNP